MTIKKVVLCEKFGIVGFQMPHEFVVQSDHLMVPGKSPGHFIYYEARLHRLPEKGGNVEITPALLDEIRESLLSLSRKEDLRFLKGHNFKHVLPHEVNEALPSQDSI